MKVVDRKTFLSMPENTVFARYKFERLMELGIKCETRGEDFLYQDLGFSIDCDFAEDIENALNTDKIFRYDFSTVDRDGRFELDAIFVVWDKEDVQSLINRLQECI